MASFVTNEGAHQFSTDLGMHWDDASTVKALLLKSGTPTKDTQFVNEISAGELTGSGYARVTVGSRSITKDTANDWILLDCADIAFAAIASGETVTWCVIFYDTGSDATSPVLICIDPTDTATNGGTITITTASGVARLAT